MDPQTIVEPIPARVVLRQARRHPTLSHRTRSAQAHLAKQETRERMAKKALAAIHLTPDLLIAFPSLEKELRDLSASHETWRAVVTRATAQVGEHLGPAWMREVETIGVDQLRRELHRHVSSTIEHARVLASKSGGATDPFARPAPAPRILFPRHRRSSRARGWLSATAPATPASGSR